MMAPPRPKERSLEGVHVGVMGLGVAGRAMARALTAHGAELTLVDENAALMQTLRPEFSSCRVVLGPVPHDVFAACAWVALSPGVAPEHPALQHVRRQGRAVVGEVELLRFMQPAPKILAITGTNGKSTTTSLAGALARGLGLDVFVGGNLGDAIGDWIHQPAQTRPAHGILELSSYQIDGRLSFCPDVAVVLNVTPDHLARYGTFERYLESKKRLVLALPPAGTAVLNADDAATRGMAHACPGQVLWFTTAAQLPAAVGSHASGMVLRDGCAVPVGEAASALAPLPLQHAVLIGAHNAQNVMAALLALSAFVAQLDGAHATARLPSQALQLAYDGYRGLPHRLSPVATVAGVRYLNDSKATNDASAATAVCAMTGSYILLVGGQDKGGGYRALAAALATRPAKAIITFGAAGELLLRTLRPLCPAVHGVDTLQDACALAAFLGAPGDTVLLSPACTSFDAFANYQARGDTFAAWVHAHAAPAPPLT